MLNYSIKQIYAVSTTFPCFWFLRLGRRMCWRCWWGWISITAIQTAFSIPFTLRFYFFAHLGKTLYFSFISFVSKFFLSEMWKFIHPNIPTMRLIQQEILFFSNTNCIPLQLLIQVGRECSNTISFHVYRTMQTQFTIKYTQGYFSYTSHSFKFIQDWK